MIKRISILSIVLITFGSQTLSAQNECLNAVANANTAYQEGKLTKCTELLQSCLSELQSDEEKIEAYRLLALSYYSLNETEKMHENIALLLKQDPTYKEHSLGRDPSAFSKVLSSYSVTPKWSVGLVIGYLSNQVNVVENHQAFAAGMSKYQATPSYIVGARFQRDLNEQFLISASLNARGSGVNQEIDLDENFNQRYKERMDMIGIGVDFGYKLNLSNKWSLQLSAKTAFDQMYNNEVNVDMFNGEDIIDLTSFDMLEYRQKGQFAVGAGMDLEYQLFRGKFAFGVSYMSYLTTTIDKDLLYDNIDFNLSTMYNNDLIKLQQLGLTLRYQYPINFNIKRNEK